MSSSSSSLCEGGMLSWPKKTASAAGAEWKERATTLSSYRARKRGSMAPSLDREGDRGGKRRGTLARVQKEGRPDPFWSLRMGGGTDSRASCYSTPTLRKMARIEPSLKGSGKKKKGGGRTSPDLKRGNRCAPPTAFAGEKKRGKWGRLFQHIPEKGGREMTFSLSRRGGAGNGKVDRMALEVSEGRVTVYRRTLPRVGEHLGEEGRRNNVS